MRKYLLLAATPLVLAACSNTATKTETAGEEPEKAPSVYAGQIDPICKMEREASWTDYVASAPGDTTWFCSATCKDAHMAKNK